MVATGSIIAVESTRLRLRVGYSCSRQELAIPPAFNPAEFALPTRQAEVYRHLGFDLDRLVVQIIGPVAPLANRVEGCLHQ
jgi:hypothetical protein